MDKNATALSFSANQKPELLLAPSQFLLKLRGDRSPATTLVAALEGKPELSDLLDRLANLTGNHAVSNRECCLLPGLNSVLGRGFRLSSPGTGKNRWELPHKEQMECATS